MKHYGIISRIIGIMIFTVVFYYMLDHMTSYIKKSMCAEVIICKSIDRLEEIRDARIRIEKLLEEIKNGAEK